MGARVSESNKGQEDSVFISYAREDSDAARRLYNDLKSHGLNLWLDKECLLPGQDWRREIRKALHCIILFNVNTKKRICPEGVQIRVGST